MTVEVTPNGSYGVRLPKLPGPLKRIFVFLNVRAFRLLANRVHPRGTHLLLLTTIGARTGLPRQTTLCGFEEGSESTGSRWLIVASSGGTARHPAWYYNLARHPEPVTVEVAGRRMQARAESLQGQEREQAWARIVAQSPNYAGYQRRTDRVIPVVRLTPLD